MISALLGPFLALSSFVMHDDNPDYIIVSPDAPAATQAATDLVSTQVVLKPDRVLIKYRLAEIDYDFGYEFGVFVSSSDSMGQMVSFGRNPVLTKRDLGGDAKLCSGSRIRLHQNTVTQVIPLRCVPYPSGSLRPYVGSYSGVDVAGMDSFNEFGPEMTFR